LKKDKQFDAERAEGTVAKPSYIFLCARAFEGTSTGQPKDPCMFFPSLDLRYFGGYAAGKLETNA
jgi:hypothetical protein